MAIFRASTRHTALLLLFLLLTLVSSHTFTSRRYVRPWDLRAGIQSKPRPRFGITNSNSSVLSRRQNGNVVPPIMDINCQWRCTVARCGCNLAGQSNQQILALSLPVSPYGTWNASAVDDLDVGREDWSSLTKRQAGGFPEDPKTKQELDEYLPKCFRQENPLFQGNAYGLTVETDEENPEATKAEQRRFEGRKAIQVGAGGLHGCTVATLMSKRGVWMSHFWQGYAMDASNAEDDEAYNDNPDDADFKKKVINFMTGEGEQDSTNKGPSIDWSLFNQEGDNTQLIIHTPGKETWNAAMEQDPSYAMYQKKAEAMAKTIASKVPGARTQVHLYDPMEYSYTIGEDGVDRVSGRDAAIVNKNARGMNYFQYDGNKKTRLFAEYDVYRHDWEDTNPGQA